MVRLNSTGSDDKTPRPSSDSESDEETQLVTKRVNAMRVGDLVCPRYSALEILKIQDKFRCDGGADCPMLALVSSVPEILRCQRNKTERRQSENGGGEKRKSSDIGGGPRSGPALSLRRDPKKPLSLNERFSLIRAAQPLPERRPKPADAAGARLIAFVDSEWL